MPKDNNPLPKVAFSILLALSLRSRHGYEIMQQVADDSNGKIKLGPGALYTSIKQLHERRLIAETSEQRDSRRRYYRLTAAGRRLLSAELEYYEESLKLARQRQALLMGWQHG